jgi:hypothetical protein
MGLTALSNCFGWSPVKESNHLSDQRAGETFSSEWIKSKSSFDDCESQSFLFATGGHVYFDSKPVLSK